jgi:hypothetical protein
MLVLPLPFIIENLRQKCYVFCFAKKYPKKLNRTLPGLQHRSQNGFPVERRSANQRVKASPPPPPRFRRPLNFGGPIECRNPTRASRPGVGRRPWPERRFVVRRPGCNTPRNFYQKMIISIILRSAP